jgi:hypothetical protein
MFPYFLYLFFQYKKLDGGGMKKVSNYREHFLISRSISFLIATSRI